MPSSGWSGEIFWFSFRTFSRGAELSAFLARYLWIAVRSCGVGSYFGFATFGLAFFVVISGPASPATVKFRRLAQHQCSESRDYSTSRSYVAWGCFFKFG